MSYLAIYRKYRPLVFSDVVGQEHITNTLVNQLISDKVAHAYLFSGSRGTGKTTCARILAKAVNCENKQNGSPCNKCSACKQVDEGCLDVTEIDAASNNKVEEVRELREKAKYLPVSLKYKVFIIDEVHMLTDSAFNALLKTLEEPPKHVLFILATTEAHKLPQTILSRCLKFDFRLIAENEIAPLVEKIYDDLGKKYEREAIRLIARAGEGSVRDALSVADMCLSLSGEKLTYADVLGAIGADDPQNIIDLADSILKGDGGAVFEAIDRLAKGGKSMAVLNKDLGGHFRNLLLIKTVNDPNKLLGLPDEIFQKMKKQADSAECDRLAFMLEIFSTAESDLRYSTQPRLIVENAALKAAHGLVSDLASLQDRIKALEKQIDILLKNT